MTARKQEGIKHTDRLRRNGPNQRQETRHTGTRGSDDPHSQDTTRGARDRIKNEEGNEEEATRVRIITIQDEYEETSSQYEMEITPREQGDKAGD